MSQKVTGIAHSSPALSLASFSASNFRKSMRSLDRFLLHPAWGEGGEAATETGADEDDGPGSF